MNVADTPTDSVRNFMSALETNDQESASGYLADNFLFSGWTPRPLNKQNFLGLIAGLKEGIPGLIFNLHNVQEQDAKVTGTIKISGYQSDSFILPQLGTPPIPQTASSITLPTEDVTYILNNNQISSLSVQHVEGGGIHGLLRQLGFDLPIIQ